MIRSRNQQGLREMADFVDRDNVRWQVVEIRDPSLKRARADLLRRPEFSSGWLLFQSPDEKRRLAPFPDDWRELDSRGLQGLLDIATPELSAERMREWSREQPRWGNDQSK